MAMLPVNGSVISLLDTADSCPSFADQRFFSVQRLPTDPLFYASLSLQNIVVGSRYWIARASDLTTVLASGVAESTEITLNNIPAYANPMLVEVRIRKASEPIKYQPFVAYGYLVRGGITVYCAQVVDNVA
jgi:hypothetical protein